MAVETTSKNLLSDASATGGGSLAGSMDGIAKKDAAGKVAVRVLYLPHVQVFLDADVAIRHGLAPGRDAVLPRLTAAMETQWQRDMKGRVIEAGEAQ